MKIVRITNFLDFGGVEKHFNLVAQANTEHEYIFVALGGGGRAEQSLISLGYSVHCLGMNVRIPNLTLIYQLIRLLRKVKPNVVHTSAAESNFHGIVASYFAKIPVRLAEEIGIPSHSLLAQFIFRLVYKMSSGVVGVSKSVTSYLVNTKEIPVSKSFTILNPAKISVYPEIFEKGDCFSIITVCRLTPVKNLDFLLQAIADLKLQNRFVELIIVGDGSEMQRLTSLSKELKINQQVRFVGFSNNPGYYLSIADLFILPSFSEGFAIALVEAMLIGTPCMSTNNGGPSEIIEHGETGWLFDPNNYQVFFRLLLEVISMSSKDLREIARKGKEDAELKYTSETYLEAIHNLYTFLKK